MRAGDVETERTSLDAFPSEDSLNAPQPFGKAASTRRWKGFAALLVCSMVAFVGGRAYLDRTASKSTGATTVETAGAPLVPAATPPSISALSNVSSGDVSGSWTLATHVESSRYAPFKGLHLGYELQLTQEGNRVSGNGRKVKENGAGIASRTQTPISVAGTLDGDHLTLTFNERGARHATQGTFDLLVDEGGTLRGRFTSTSAQSSGAAEARRQ